MTAPQRAPTFNEKLASLIPDVTYRLVRTARERDAVFALRYRGYFHDGGIPANESERFSDPWDDSDNMLLLAMDVGGEIASTVRFHMNWPAGARMPAMDTFGDVLAPYIAAGKRMIDPTRFVIDPEVARRGPEGPYLTLRMIAMAGEHFRPDIVLATVREDHMVMYRRVCGFQAISEPRAYPLLKRRIVCSAVELDTMCASIYGRHPFLESTQAEREAIFGPQPGA